MEGFDDMNEFKQDAPTLYSLENKGDFLAPDGFFDHFPHNIQDKVKGVHSGIQMPFWKGMVITLPLIAVIVAVSGILIRMTADDDSAGFAGVSNFEMEEVLEYADADVLLADIDIDDLPVSVFDANSASSDLNDDELEELIEQL